MLGASGGEEIIGIKVDATETGIASTISEIDKLEQRLQKLAEAYAKVTKPVGNAVNKEEAATIASVTDKRGKDAAAALKQAQVQVQGQIAMQKSLDETTKS